MSARCKICKALISGDFYNICRACADPKSELAPASGSEARYLTIPTVPPTLIPLGMSRDDFQLVNLTLSMWEHRIAPFPPNDTPIEKYCGILADYSQNTERSNRADEASNLKPE